MVLLRIIEHNTSATTPNKKLKMPGDLNLKKSWNPALKKNQKKLWEREQEVLKEHQAIKQRSKEIALEREKEQMIKLQYENDPSKLPPKQKLELSKLGWMYSDMPKADDDENGFKEVEEDFLENTQDVQQLLQGNRPAFQSVTSRFDKVASVGAGRASANLSDDPLLLIRKQQIVQSSKRERSTDRGSSRGSQSSDRHRGSYSRNDASLGRESDDSHRSEKHGSSSDRKRSSSDRHRFSSERHSSNSDRQKSSSDRHRSNGDRHKSNGDSHASGS